MHDQVFIALFASLPGIIAAVVGGWVAVEQVRQKRIQAAQGLVIDKTHRLVNSAMTAQLKLTMLATRRIAEDHPDEDLAVESARIAKDAYDHHVAAQAREDQRGKE